MSNPGTAAKRDGRHTADLVGSVLLVAFGVAVAVGGSGYGLRLEGGRVGPGLMPLVAGSALALFGMLVGAEAVRRRDAPGAGFDAERTEAATERSEAATEESSAPSRSVHQPARFVAVVSGLTLGAVLLVQPLGFLISFALLVFLLIAAVERQGWASALLISAGSAAITWLIFVRLLQVPLPTGPFERIIGL